MVNGSKILFKELSYRINGIIFAAHNELGKSCSENQYADAIEEKLKENNIKYEREKILSPSFKGELKGRNRVDFIIEGKLILELKAKHFLTREDFYQTKRYLKATNLSLALLVNFRQDRAMIKRVLNSSA